MNERASSLVRTGQGACASGGGGAADSVNGGGAVEMGSVAAAVFDVMTAAATSLDFFDAVAISLVFFFDLGFLVFFGRALVSVPTLPSAIDFLVRGGAMKLSARRTASLRRSGGGSWTNGAEAFGDAVGVNCDEFGRAAWRSWKAVLPGELGSKHLVDSFCIGRVGTVASR